MEHILNEALQYAFVEYIEIQFKKNLQILELLSYLKLRCILFATVL